jgi:hypothetical protein
MTKPKFITTAIIATAVAVIFTGCSKQSMTPASTSPQTVSAAVEEMLLTPAGYMPKSKVHFIEQGYHVSIEAGRYKKVEDATGAIVQDFGVADEANASAPDLGTSNNTVPANSGWITYSEWGNDTTTESPVTYFNTKWKVPAVPSTNHGQTIFLFNGMQDGFSGNAHILQPVLQWGGSAAGGGSFWSITNWYVGSSAFFGSLVNVAAGTTLQGRIQQTAQSGVMHTYTSSFIGYTSTDITVTNVPQLWWSAETLETYGTTANSDYPNATLVKMNAIQIKKGTANATITWTPVKAFTSGPQNTVIVSNASPNGEVDIYFKKAK